MRLAIAVALCAVGLAAFAEEYPVYAHDLRTVKPYLYEIWYDGYEDSEMKGEDAPFGDLASQYHGGCSSVRVGGFHGRNLDIGISDLATIVVHTKAAEGRFASVGTTQWGDVTETALKAKEVSDHRFDVLPNWMLDGINENGVAININVIPMDVRQEGDGTDDRPALHARKVVRYVLDHAESAEAVIEQLKGFRIYGNIGTGTYNLHWMISDAEKTFVVEVINGQVVAREHPIMTNFHLNWDNANQRAIEPSEFANWSPSKYENPANYSENPEGILSFYTRHAEGVERYIRLRDANYETRGQTFEGMFDLMREVQFTRIVDLPLKETFLSDLPELAEMADAGIMSLTDIYAASNATKLAAVWETLQPAMWNVYANLADYRKSGEIANYSITTHNVTFDLAHKMFRIVVQEEYDQPFDFYLSPPSAKSVVVRAEPGVDYNGSTLSVKLAGVNLGGYSITDLCALLTVEDGVYEPDADSIRYDELESVLTFTITVPSDKVTAGHEYDGEVKVSFKNDALGETVVYTRTHQLVQGEMVECADEWFFDYGLEAPTNYVPETEMPEGVAARVITTMSFTGEPFEEQYLSATGAVQAAVRIVGDEADGYKFQFYAFAVDEEENLHKGWWDCNVSNVVPVAGNNYEITAELMYPVVAQRQLYTVAFFAKDTSDNQPARPVFLGNMINDDGGIGNAGRLGSVSLTGPGAEIILDGYILVNKLNANLAKIDDYEEEYATVAEAVDAAEDVSIRLLHAASWKPTEADVGKPVRFLNKSCLNLDLSGIPGEMKVHWTNVDGNDGTLTIAPVVRVTAESDEGWLDLREEVALVEGETTVSNVTWSATQWGEVSEVFTTVGWTNLSTGATGEFGNLSNIMGEGAKDAVLPAKDGDYVLTHSTGDLTSFATFTVSGTGAPVGSKSNPWVVGKTADDGVVAYTNGVGGVVIGGEGDMKDFTADDAPWGKGIASVSIGEDVTGIGTNAFKGCASLKDVTVLATVPPTLGADAFAGCDIQTITVPKRTGPAYRSAPGWSDYAGSISEMHNFTLLKADGTPATGGYTWDEETGVLTVTNDGLVVTGTTADERVVLLGTELTLRDLCIYTTNTTGKSSAMSCVMISNTVPVKVNIEGKVEVHAVNCRGIVMEKGGSLILGGTGDLVATSDTADAILVRNNGDLTITDSVNLTARSSTYSTIAASRNIVIESTGCIDVRGEGASAICPDTGTLKIGAKATNIVARGFDLANGIGALEFTFANAVKLPAGWAIFGSPDIDAADMPVAAELRQVPGKSFYTAYVGDSVAQAVTFGPAGSLTIPAVNGAFASVGGVAVPAGTVKVPAGKTSVVTWKPRVGHVITSGETEAIVMDGPKTAKAPQVVYGGPGSKDDPWTVGPEDDPDSTVAWVDEKDNTVYFEPPRGTVSRTGLEAVTNAMGNATFDMLLVSPDGTSTNGIEMILGASGKQYRDLAEMLATDEDTFRLFDVNGCIVNYNGNGAAGEMPSETFLPGIPTNLAANAFTAAGYAFEGWTTNGAGGRIVFEDRAAIADPQPGVTYDLKAVWTPVSTTVGSYDDLKKVLDQAAKIGKPVEIVLDGTIAPPAGEALVLPAVVDVEFSGDGKIGGLVFKEGVDWFADSIAEHSDAFAYVDPSLTNIAGLVIYNGLPEENRPIDLAALTNAMEKAMYLPAVTPLNALVSTGDGTAAMPAKWVDEKGNTYETLQEAIDAPGAKTVTPDFGSEEDPVPPKVIAGDVIGEDGNRYTWDVVNETPDVVIEEPLAVIGTIDGLAAFAEEALADVKFTIAPKPVDKTPGSDCDKMIQAITEGNYEPAHVSVATFTPSADGVTVTTPGSQLFAIPLKVKTVGRTNFRVARIHGGVAEAFTEILDEADRRDGTFIVGDGVVIAFSDKFSFYAVTSSDATQVTLPKETKATYAVTNLTTGAEIRPSGRTADGRPVYDLPVGLTVSITATRRPGYVIDGRNPLVIPVTGNEPAMQALIDAELPKAEEDDFLVYDFTASLKTTKAKKGKTKTTYTVNLGHDGNEYWWKALGYSDNKTAKDAVSKEFKACKTDAAKAAYVLDRFGFDVNAANPQTRWPIAEKYDARGNPKAWCHTLKFSLTSSDCYRVAGSVKLKDTVYIYTGSGDWSFADQRRWISVPLLHRFGGISLAKATKVEMVGGYEQDGRPLRMAGQGVWADKLGKDAKTGLQVGGLKSLNGNLVGVLPGPECESCCDYDEPALVFDCAGLPVDFISDPSQNTTAAFGTFSLKFNKKASKLK